MLSADIIDTIDLIEKYQKTKKQVKNYESYLSFYTKLKQIQDEFNEFKRMMNLIDDYELNIFDDLEFEKTIEKINDLLEKLDGFEVPSKRKLYKLSEIIENKDLKLKEEWQEKVKQISRDNLNTLQIVKKLLSNTNKIDDIKSRIEIVKNKWPFAEKELQSYEKAIEDSRKIIEELEIGEDGEEIKDFLRLVSMGKATLADINKKILTWIRKNNFDQNLEIKFFKKQV